MSSIFSKIIREEIPSYKIGETDNCFAFLDINPLAKGHVLVVPKTEIDYIFDLESDLFCELHLFAKKIALAMGAVITCERIGMAVIGLEVPHAHIHLVPLNNVTDIDFSREKLALDKTEMEQIAEKIKNAI